MTTDISTETLAKLYEEQGYYRDALEQYAAVNRENPSADLEEAVQRMRQKLKESDMENRRRKAVDLAEKWIGLLLLRRRLKNAEKFSGKSHR